MQAMTLHYHSSQISNSTLSIVLEGAPSLDSDHSQDSFKGTVVGEDRIEPTVIIPFFAVFEILSSQSPFCKS